ncbi:ABC transporter substrate-binding protein [Paralcaligenes ureilyticus]|uniref:NitT/TauT family transport system substrate-binding protein n=1 Tax=Paralcaligenes ureilyticus TaxID=627131 RepID=A0A4R3LXH8_9BURK|nr:ABC transporter substrate-binding protein [Paralcaligenes ureilyticus]TCT05293.1 NitT/TauT family transport system substrate-binding protein [Paralcaligenes ureilyticus]
MKQTRTYFTAIPNPLRRRIGLTVVGLILSVGAMPVYASAAGLVEVRVGTNGVVSDAPFFIAQQKGYFAQEGIKVTFVSFNAGPMMIAPLGAGQLDVAAGAMSAGLFNAASRGINIKVVADKGSTPPLYDYMPILVRKSLVDSGKIKSMKDFKGLKVGEGGKGGSPGSKLNEALKIGGLSYKDVQHEYLGYPQQVTALANGAIDAAVSTEPSVTQAIEKGIAVRFPHENPYPNQEVAVLLYGGDFIKNKPQVAKKFMVAYLKGARFYNGALKNGRFAGPNAGEVIAILVRDSRVKDPALYKGMTPNGINPDGKLNLTSLRKDFQFYKDQGYLQGSATVNQVVDESFAHMAVKELGPYKPIN